MIVNYVAELDPTDCTGCKRCDIACPSGAISVTDKKAVIDGVTCRQVNIARVQKALDRQGVRIE